MSCFTFRDRSSEVGFSNVPCLSSRNCPSIANARFRNPSELSIARTTLPATIEPLGVYHLTNLVVGKEPAEVIGKSKNHNQYQDGYTDLLGNFDNTLRDPPARHHFNQVKENMTPVQYGDRQQIYNSEVDTDDSDEVGKSPLSFLGLFACSLENENGSPYIFR